MVRTVPSTHTPYTLKLEVCFCTLGTLQRSNAHTTQSRTVWFLWCGRLHRQARSAKELSVSFPIVGTRSCPSTTNRRKSQQIYPHARTYRYHAHSVFRCGAITLFGSAMRSYTWQHNTLSREPHSTSFLKCTFRSRRPWSS